MAGELNISSFKAYQHCGMSSRPTNFGGMNFNARGGIGGQSLRSRTSMLGGSMAVMEPPWLKLAFSRDDAQTYLERFATVF